MKTFRITTQTNGTFDVGSLPLPAQQRKGPADAEPYRRQASGVIPMGNFGPEASSSLRAIVLSKGNFKGLAAQPGSLLTFVISGNLTLRIGLSEYSLEPGDIFLTDEESSSKVTLDVPDQGQLVQIDVAANWPGPDAQVPDSDPVPRKDAAQNFKRIYTAEDGKAYFTSFREMFLDVANEWTKPLPILGFRMLCWENGSIGHHPNVVNQLGIVSAGQLELQVSGNGAKEIFRPGDICLTEDRVGEGHANRTTGMTRVTTFVVPTEDLWPWVPEA
jgi:hypothetical protein